MQGFGTSRQELSACMTSVAGLPPAAARVVEAHAQRRRHRGDEAGEGCRPAASGRLSPNMSPMRRKPAEVGPKEQGFYFASEPK